MKMGEREPLEVMVGREVREAMRRRDAIWPVYVVLTKTIHRPPGPEGRRVVGRRGGEAETPGSIMAAGNVETLAAPATRGEPGEVAVTALRTEAWGRGVAMGRRGLPEWEEAMRGISTWPR